MTAEPAITLRDMPYDWHVYRDGHYIGVIEPTGKRYKAKYSAHLVRSAAGPDGLYESRDAAVTALVERRET